MKKIFGFTLVILVSLSFGRVSSYNVVVVSPVESFIQKKQLEVSSVNNGYGDDSVQWKRRHKRRKKIRRPQRGR